MKTIRSRILTSMVITGLVPLLVVLMPLGTVLKQQLTLQEERKLAQTARQLGRLISEVNDRSARELSSLQTNPLLCMPGGSIEVKLAELRRLVDIYEVYSDISLYDGDGYLIASTSDDHPAFREYSDWFRDALDGKVVLSHPQRKLGKDGLYTTVYLPIAPDEKRARKDRIVAKASLSFSRVISIVDDNLLAGDNPVYLLDDRGNILSGGDPSRFLSKFDPRTKVEKWLLEETGNYEHGSSNYLFARTVIDSEVTRVGSPWILIALQPMEKVTALIWQAFAYLLAGIVIMMSVALTLGMLLSRLISRPLEAIGAVADQVASGDLAIRASETVGSSETKTLARLFNRMVGEVAEHRESLENLVASRTESLHLSQMELERANALLQAALQSTNNGFLVEDLGGEVLLVNDLFLLLLGLDPASESSRGMDAVLSTLTEQADLAEEEFARWMESRGSGGLIDAEIRFGQESPRVLHIFSSPVRDSRERVVGRVWCTQDLTEQRQLEEGLRQSQKMEAVGQLAGGVAHDFNNLLAGILGNLALVKMEIGENSSTETRESLAFAIKAGERAAELVRQLLGFSRRSRLNLKSCDPNLVLAEVRDLLAATIDPRIEIRLELEPTPWRAMADVGMLGQVIMNMAVNAKDAMPKGGRLTLSTRNVALTEADLRAHPETAPGEFIRMTVEDEGEGIPYEIQKKIFEPFFTTKEPGKGTGLGLATSFGIVKQLGGWIDFTSVPGEGTRFEIFLPRNAAAETQDSSTLLTGPGREGLTASSRNEKILLVDDEALVRRIGRTLLSKLGYGIIEACDGLEAVEICRERADEISLVLLDLTMPRMTGKETFARLREMYPDLPVLICSGYLVDLNEFTRECGSCPDGFVQKPYSFEEMSDMVRRTLDNARVHAA